MLAQIGILYGELAVFLVTGIGSSGGSGFGVLWGRGLVVLVAIA